MFQGRYISTGNITGNSYVIGSSSLCNSSPNLFGGYSQAAGQTAIFKDGASGPIVYLANSVAMQGDTEVFAFPIFCANGLYVNQNAATANISVLLG